MSFISQDDWIFFGFSLDSDSWFFHLVRIHGFFDGLDFLTGCWIKNILKIWKLTDIGLFLVLHKHWIQFFGFNQDFWITIDI